MGRKSHSKHGAKKSTGKEIGKAEQQKRKDLAVHVAKLLKITSLFQSALTPTQNWNHYVEVDSIVKQINNLELLGKKNTTRTRQANLQRFTTWLEENGAKYEGIEISQFEDYDLGLKANKDFPEGSLMLTVPKKLMMSEKDALESTLSDLISVDPLLQNMPNITLAFFLLLEKHNADSFWKPYIDILPDKYSTVLYFTPEELTNLKPSPVLETGMKLYRNIARQYAYFYNKIHVLDLPVTKTLRDIFTFENYRWAVSTVMTRQNSIQFASADVTAFIPLWDMCNHEQGKITTDFNKELDRGECYALRDFKSGEQLFIFYGARPNSDLFLHNGFVYPQNIHDSLSLALGVSASDNLYEQRVKLLTKLGLGNVTHYSIYRSEALLSAELLAFIRIFIMNEEELTKWLTEGVPSDLVSSEPASADKVGVDIDLKAYKYLLTRCKLLRASYDKQSDVAQEETLHRKNIRLLKESEVQILDNAIKYLEEVTEKLAQPAIDKK